MVKSLKTFKKIKYLWDDFKGDFSRAASSIGTTVNTILVVEKAGICNSAVTLASNIFVIWFPNAICTGSGSLTINGFLIAGEYQLVDGVTLNLGSNVKTIFPKWWGNDNPPIVLHKRNSDPDTTGWGANEAARCWFNTTDKKVKAWNSEEIVLLG